MALRLLGVLFLVATIGVAGELDEAARYLASAKDEDHARGASLCADLGPRAAPLAANLAGKLRHRTPWIRGEVLKALTAIGPGAFGAVLPLLAWEDAEIRTSAARLLAGYAESMERITQRPAPLVRALTDADVRVRDAMARVLLRCGPDCLPPLLRVAAADDPFVREAAARVIALHATPAALAELASSPDAATRETAARALGWAGGAEGAPPLIRLLKDDVEGVRGQAARALGRLKEKSEAVLRALAASFLDSSSRVRLACADGVAAFGEPVRERVLGDSSLPKDCFARVLAGLGNSEFRLTVELMSESPEVRADVARGLIGTAATEPTVEIKLHQMLAGDSLAGAVAAAATLTSYERHMDDALTVLLRAASDEVAVTALAVHGVRARPAVTQLIANLKDGAPALRRASIKTLVAIRNSRALDLASAAESVSQLPPDVRRAVEGAWGWLARTQNESGSWSSANFGGLSDYDSGLTALGLLALRAAEPQTIAQQRKARDFLLARQDEQGWLAPRASNRICQHSIATWALAESLMLSPDRLHRLAVQKAVALLEAARNPHLGWRYESRGGENDTHETAWATSALQFASRAGVAIDPAAAVGALNWLEKMTDPEFGQVGYNMPGGSAARLEQLGAPTTSASRDAAHSQAMTPAALWCKQLIGTVKDSEPHRTIWGIVEEGELRRKSEGLVLEKRPVWDPSAGTIDLCYWHWGALALAPVANSAGAIQWYAALRAELVSVQSTDGSWDPIDAWGSVGGRVYSTAMALLALLGPNRYPREVFDPGFVPPWRAPVDAALLKASKDKDPIIRYAALRGMAGLAPFEE